MTLGKAALATSKTGRCTQLPRVALNAIGPMTGAGPLPRRVAALLAPRPRVPLLSLAANVAVLAVTAVCACDAVHDMYRLLSLAHSAHRA